MRNGEDLENCKDRVHERLLRLVELDPETDCWVYTGPWQQENGLFLPRSPGVASFAPLSSAYRGEGRKTDTINRTVNQGRRVKGPRRFTVRPGSAAAQQHQADGG